MYSATALLSCEKKNVPLQHELQIEYVKDKIQI